MVEQYIRINQGEYGRTLLSGEVFPFLGHGRTPKGQMYVTVDGARVNIPGIEPRRCRVKIDSVASYTPVSKEVFLKEARATEAVVTLEQPKTQENAWQRYNNDSTYWMTWQKPARKAQ